MPGERPIPDAAVHELEIDGEITLMHRGTQTALVLNETASDVWRLMDGERTVDDIKDTLCRAYAAEAAAVRGGVDSALTMFREHGFLTPVDG